MSSDQPLIVQALFAFKGTNNDELWFKKGDLITVTQKEEGGWWEGTLGDKTGWFPTNFVKEVKDKDVMPSPITPVTQQKQYRAVVLKDLIDSEKAHVAELQGLVKTFLKPLEKSTILTIDEYRQLTGNITEVVETHLQLLELLEESETKPSDEQKVGKIFLTWAPKIKSVHQAYCSMHPKAVCILDLHKDELATYMESCGATTPGLLVLTTGLSKPFRRLDKYSGMLQELERHVEVNHPDRGDTQRSVAVYKDIAASCAALRRQKELELQVLTGPVRGWEGQSLAHLGDILHMGSVAVGPQHQDRYLVLFPDTLLVLSVSKRMSAFIYEGKLPLTGITITRLEDTDNYKNAFEITGHLIEKIVAICQSKEEANNWVDLLRRHTKGHHKTPPPAGGNATENVPPPPPHLDRRGYCIRCSVISYNYSSPFDYQITLPPWFYPPASPYSTLTKSFYRLVKEKIITHRLLKKLLYPEYANFHLEDLDGLVVRRKHKTECFIRTGSYLKNRGASSSCSDSENSDSESNDDSDRTEDGNNLQRQNAIVCESSGSDGSRESNPFGFIKYFHPTESSTSEANSFVDHGSDIIQPRINYSSDQEIEDKPPILEDPSNLDARKLCNWNQISEESGNSSFDCVTKPYMACEDLVNIDESTEMDNTINSASEYIPKTRHSLPTKFVANKFNKSSLTMVYIPSWQSNSDSNLGPSKNSDKRSTFSSEVNLKISSASEPITIKIKSDVETDNNSDDDSTTTHSSCLELPICLPVPDAIVAELLYNSGPETESLLKSESVDSEPEDRQRSVIKPPSMFENKTLEDNNRLSLRKSTISFNKHCLDSDKRTKGQLIQSQHRNKTNSLRKCVSYHYLQLSEGVNCSSSSNQFCRCCTEPCSSRRSSDSGMAGSCTLNSPDLALNNEDLPSYPKRDVVSLSEIDACNFEAQCRCTSPFDSTPRTSCQASTSDHIVEIQDSTTSITSSTNSDSSPFETPCPWESENQIYEKVMKMKCEVKQRREHLRNKLSRSCENFQLSEASEESESEEEDTPIYSSGLYAHWWLKAKLPNEVLRGILEESVSDVVNDHAQSSKPAHK